VAAASADFPFNILIRLPSQPSETHRGELQHEQGGMVVDRTTFDRLVLEHLDAAHRFAIRLCGNANDAEDVMQDALLRAHRGWTTFRGDARFKTWLFQIVLNCFRDHLASRLRLASLSEEQVDDATGPTDEAEAKELGEVVAREVTKLPPRQREVLVLSAYERLSNGEIALMLAMNEQNVRTTLHLARQRLKERLSKYIGTSK
jgi:RNA polymerase sigma-70 factor (ECF subfamily)